MIKKPLYFLSKLLIDLYTRMMINLDVIWQVPLPEGPRIIAANHPSTSDPLYVALLNARRSPILINNALFTIPVLKQYLHLSGHIPVIAGRGAEALETATRLLKKGRSIIIFPEGGISPLEGGFLEPHTGVARLAMATGAPVVPAGIYIPPKNLSFFTAKNEDGEKLPATWLFKGRYNVTFGKPQIYNGSLEDRDLVRQNSRRIMDDIIHLSEISQRRLDSNTFLHSQPFFRRKRIISPLLPMLLGMD